METEQQTTASDEGFDPKPSVAVRQELGRRLFTLMINKEWTQSRLAREAGLGRDAISKYIRGTHFPKAIPRRKIAQALGVSEAELLPPAVMAAAESEFPAVELRQAPGHPDKTWLRVNRLLPFDTAVQIVALINDADKREAVQGS